MEISGPFSVIMQTVPGTELDRTRYGANTSDFRKRNIAIVRVNKPLLIKL